MGHTEEASHIDPTDSKFGFRDWLGAVLGIAAVMAGALTTLAVVYWAVTSR